MNTERHAENRRGVFNLCLLFLCLFLHLALPYLLVVQVVYGEYDTAEHLHYIN